MARDSGPDALRGRAKFRRLLAALFDRGFPATRSRGDVGNRPIARVWSDAAALAAGSVAVGGLRSFGLIDAWH